MKQPLTDQQEQSDKIAQLKKAHCASLRYLSETLAYMTNELFNNQEEDKDSN